MSNSTPSFGGNWTKQKLEILQKYLDAYTTALKNTRFKLLYIDAFAGSGVVELREKQEEEGCVKFIPGSATIATKIQDKPFDKLLFIEQDKKRYESLLDLKNNHPDRKITLRRDDANHVLQELCSDWGRVYPGYRGVLFLDPFATQVKWETVEAVAETKVLDVWLLFPVSAVARMLPKSKKPDEIDEKWVLVLNWVFGDESWRELYSKQQTLFGEDYYRKEGVKDIIEIYKNKLKAIVGKRLLGTSKPLKISTNSPLFELIFFAGSFAGVQIAHRIVKQILDNT